MDKAETFPTERRVQAVRARMAAHNLDAFVTIHGSNRRYLSGFTGSAGMAAVLPDAAVLLVDFRYTEQANQQATGWEVHQVTSFFKGLAELLAERGARRCGFEQDRLTYGAWRKLEEEVGFVEWVPTASFVEEVRGIKEPGELASLGKAVALADRAFDYMLEKARPGMTERSLALELEFFLRREGAEALSFPPIVASGPNAALPHARPTDRRLQEGDLLLLDYGCVVEGYCSDITRTVSLGPASEREKEIYHIVLRAQQAALAAIRPGMEGKAVDGVARGIIEEAGYGPYFGHGLGHGVGLDVHEDIPRLSQQAEVTLQPGMVCSVEPGIYIPGWGGVRIEDLIVVTDDGCRILTAAPKELIELPV